MAEFKTPSPVAEVHTIWLKVEVLLPKCILLHSTCTCVYYLNLNCNIWVKLSLCRMHQNRTAISVLCFFASDLCQGYLAGCALYCICPAAVFFSSNWATLKRVLLTYKKEGMQAKAALAHLCKCDSSTGWFVFFTVSSLYLQEILVLAYDNARNPKG